MSESCCVCVFMLQARGMHSIPAEVYPWGSDLLSFARVVKSYVQSYVDVYWPTDADLMGDR